MNLDESMKSLEQAALKVKAERDRMQYALENILAMTAGQIGLNKVIHEQARKGLGEVS